MIKELKIQKALRSRISLTKLNNDYGIIHKQSVDNPSLYLFKYDQIRSPMTEQLVQECRGLILDKEKNWNIVCFPYTKFFNYGETNAATLDLNSTYAYPKLDGSLMSLYYYNNKWCVATSGNPDAAGPIYSTGNNTISFKEFFWKTWNELGYSLPSVKAKGFCFMFELISPFNRVVVNYKTNNIILHGIKDLFTNLELDINNKDIYSWKEEIGIANWHYCKKIPFNNIEELINTTEELDPLQQEGFILVDGNFNRVKIKNSSYVRLHHVRSNVSFKSILEIIRNNEGEEFLQYFPEYKDLYIEVETKFDICKSRIKNAAAEFIYKKQRLELEGLQLERKEVGLAFKNTDYVGMMFPIIFEDKKVEDCLVEMSINKLLIWLENIK